LDASGFPARRLEIEITETAVLEEGEQVDLNIAALKQIGCKFALDDFGAGYTSLRHLRRHAFDKLKIDRDFIIDCGESSESATIVHAVVSIGRALGMKVIAEGVETDGQREFLKVAGVHALQGYLLARPEPIEALFARLQGAKDRARAAA
jgi:EAL domain-containing protein (putative c-di-GMP-specific phosphodiesterase class I)